MTRVIEANSVECPPKGEYGEDCLFFRVGLEGTAGNETGDHTTKRKVTRITVTDDLPGPHCMLWQVRVYAGDDIICEIPKHACESIIYKAGDFTHEMVT